MAGFSTIIAFVVLMVTLAAAIPVPGGGWGGKHEHYVIHVPYNVHHVHHHHVKKIAVPVPIVKEHVIVKNIHHEPIIHAPIIHHEPIIHHAPEPWW